MRFAQKVNKASWRGRIRTASGSDRPNTQLLVRNLILKSMGVQATILRLNLWPVATARGSDTVKHFLCKAPLLFVVYGLVAEPLALGISSVGGHGAGPAVGRNDNSTG